MNLHQVVLCLGALLMASGLRGQSYSSSLTCNTGTIVDGALHGSGTSFADFDGDGWPDLTMGYYEDIRCYRNVEGVCELFEIDLDLQSDVKLPTWVDFDNDGDRDLFITQRQGPDRLFENDGDFNFTDITVEAGFSNFPAPSFGSSWADYDRDGDLDVYICHFVSVVQPDDDFYELYFNNLYRNNGDGTFTEVTDEAGVSDGISLSFQSAWFDYNRDGWPDLYVINDLEDPNRLYHNNGDGSFTEVGEESNSATAITDAMSATVGDFNNDGWEDIFITAVAIQNCVLLLNQQDGTFTDIATEAGVDLDKLCWGANWLDADLDGDLDLYVCENFYESPGLPNVLMRNNGDSTFTDISTVLQLDFQDSYSVSSADWNLDGTPDLLVSNLAPQVNNLWKGQTQSGTWIALDPVGSVSNIEGVGVEIEVWANGIYQYRMNRMGENYLSQDGDAEMFGLANAASIDSLRLTWPSGIVDFWEEVAVNQHWQVVEGASQLAEIVTSDLSACAGDSLTLTCNCPGASVWSTGEAGDAITVEESGWYLVTSTNASGVESQDSVYAEFITPLAVELEIQEALCYGESGSASIVNPEFIQTIDWQGSDPDSLLQGEYPLTWTDINGCDQDSILVVNAPDSLGIQLEVTDVLCHGDATGTVSLSPFGGSPDYSIEAPEGFPNALSAGQYSIAVSDANGCQVDSSFSISQPDALAVGLEWFCTGDSIVAAAFASGGTLPYAPIEWSDGSVGNELSAEWMGDDYFAIAVDANQCEALSETIWCEVSVFDFEAPSLRMVPNPSSEKVWILGLKRPLPYRIYDASGLCLKTGIVQSGLPISVQDLSPGLYTVLVGSRTFRLVREGMLD